MPTLHAPAPCAPVGLRVRGLSAWEMMMLSACERRFVIRCQETEDPAARIALWRACGLPNATDERIREKLRTLLDRPDAQACAEGYQRRQGILERARERDVVEQRADTEAIANEIRQATLEDLDAARQLEMEALRTEKRKSVQGLSRLAAQIDAMTKNAPEGAGISADAGREKWLKAKETVARAKQETA